MAYDFDLFTIGAGSGGVRASRVAALLGARVGIAEADRIGGTCVIRGCIPKKLLVYASHFRDEFEDAKAYGWTLEAPHFDWAALRRNTDKEIERLSGIYRRNLAAAGVEIFESRALLKDAHTVHLSALKRDVTAERILIATGGHPVKPDGIRGIEHVVDSDAMFALPALPSSALIIGGGYIAVEFAGILHGLGVPVSLVYRSQHLLRGFDADLGKALEGSFKSAGLTLYPGNTVAAVERDGHRYRVTLADGTILVTGLVLAATGRDPNVAGLGLERVGVAQKPNGAIAVDDRSRSNVPNIYAVGDVTDRRQLTPVAIREGQAFAESVFGKTGRALSYENIPTAIFSQPPIGTVGLTEAEALAHHGAADIYQTTFRPLKHTLTGREEHTLMKLVVDTQSGLVLGCHIFGADAPEMIQCLAIAMRVGVTKEDFDATVAVHPTSAEELVTLRTKTRRVVSAGS